jgi:DNA-binding HxlR family transcriptional regulator
VIIGSPHPGPNELRLLAGLNGDAFETEVIEESRDGHHYSRREPTEEAKPYLHHVREHSVAQAVLRFGRQDGATVFVHTAALPQWMQSLCDEALIRLRSEGEQSVIQVLSELEEATTTEIADKTDFTADTARKHLKNLESDGIVIQEGDSHRITWSATEKIHQVSPTASIDWLEAFS